MSWPVFYYIQKGNTMADFIDLIVFKEWSKWTWKYTDRVRLRSETKSVLLKILISISVHCFKLIILSRFYRFDSIIYTISRVMLIYLKATVVLCKRLVKVCYKLPLYKRLVKVCYKFDRILTIFLWIFFEVITCTMLKRMEI